MATKKKQYTARVIPIKEMKDYAFVITDNSNDSEVIRKSGYSTKANAWRGFYRRTNLFKLQNIHIEE